MDYLAVHGVNKAFLDPRKIKRLQAAAEPCWKPMKFLAGIRTSLDAAHDRVIRAKPDAGLGYDFSPELTLRSS